jgi:Inositol-pentakisphosphate 2-kinase
MNKSINWCLRFNFQTSLSQVTADKFQELYSADNAYIDDLLQKVNSLKKMLPAMPSEETTKWYMKKLSACECYMLGATALDCSLMVTFRKLGSDEVFDSNDPINKHVISVGNTRFVTKATIMDLDPKVTSHYNKMIKQFNASQVAYKSFLRNKLIE